MLVIVQPETVIAWRRRRFREHWTKLSGRGKKGRPTVARELRDLIRRMSSANLLWGTPKIVGELGKIGIEVAKSTVEKYMVRRRKRPSSTWRAFLKNHIRKIVAADLFVVPTVRNQVLFVFLLIVHDRRRVHHVNVTVNPTTVWAAHQILEAFPWTDPPRYLLRDRDKIYGQTFRKRIAGMGFEEILIAARSPSQSPYGADTHPASRRPSMIVVEHATEPFLALDFSAGFLGWPLNQLIPEALMISLEARGRTPMSRD